MRNLSELDEKTICLRCDGTDLRVAKLLVKACLRVAEAYIAIGNVGRVMTSDAACSCLVAIHCLCPLWRKPEEYLGSQFGSRIQDTAHSTSCKPAPGCFTALSNTPGQQHASVLPYPPAQCIACVKLAIYLWRRYAGALGTAACFAFAGYAVPAAAV